LGHFINLSLSDLSEQLATTLYKVDTVYKIVASYAISCATYTNRCVYVTVSCHNLRNAITFFTIICKKKFAIVGPKLWFIAAR